MENKNGNMKKGEIMKKSWKAGLMLLVVLVMTLTACLGGERANGAPNGSFAVEAGSSAALFLDADSSTLSKIEKESGVDIYTVFRSTGEVKNNLLQAKASEVQSRYVDAQAFMPESSFWIPSDLSGEPILRSYPVYGVTGEFLRAKGLNPGDIVTFAQIDSWTVNKESKMALCNVTQCDVGGLFYFSGLFYYSRQTVLDIDLAKNEPVIVALQTLMSNIDISTASTQDLKKEFVDNILNNTGKYNSIWIYEADLADIDKTLVENGMEPVYPLYVELSVPATQTFVCSPAFASKEFEDTKEQCEAVKSALTNVEIQKLISEESGWRPVKNGVAMPSSLKTEWGFKADPMLATSLPPRHEVAMPLLRTFVNQIRSEVFMTLILDLSGSMRRNGGFESLSASMDWLMSQSQLEADFLEMIEGDVTNTWLFDNTCHNLGFVEGRNEPKLREFYVDVANSTMNGETYMYDCGIQAVAEVKAYLDTRGMSCDTIKCVFVFMTDGRDNGETTVDALKDAIDDSGMNLDVWVVTFGNSIAKDQIETLVSDDKICNGSESLVDCFKQIKGSSQ